MIAVATDAHSIFGRHVQDGVHRFAQASGSSRWRDFVAIPSGKLGEFDLSAYRPDGLIISVSSTRLQREAQKLAVPTVNVSGSLARPGFASVLVDNVKVGEIAARHFLERDHHGFIFVAPATRRAYAEQRGRGFAAAVADAGYQVRWVGHRPRQRMHGIVRDKSTIAELLLGCPKPVAVFAVDDVVAAQVHASVDAMGLHVPDQVAILGVNDEPEMHFGSLGLSSIVLPFDEIGFQSAARLDRMLDGHAPSPHILRLPPGRIITRASSDTRAIKDPIVNDALRFIRREACNGARVEDVARALPISRRSLHRRFTEAVGRTLIEELTRIRVARACELLSTTQFSIAEVSEASGFGDRSRFSAAFRTATGQTPTQYRRRTVRSDHPVGLP